VSVLLRWGDETGNIGVVCHVESEKVEGKELVYTFAKEKEELVKVKNKI